MPYKEQYRTCEAGRINKDGTADNTERTNW